MKLVSFRHRGETSFGAVQGEAVADLGSVLRNHYEDLRALLADGDQGRARLSEAAQGTGATIGVDEIDFLLPIRRPEKIFCVGRNYGKYHEVQDDGEPEYPSIFCRILSSFAAHEEALEMPPVSEQYDYEGELGVIIGRRGRHIERDDAMAHVAGYTIVNEGSVRDWQTKGTQNTPGKNFYRSGAIGPWMVTADEIESPGDLDIKTWVNGDLRQDGNTAQMLANIPYLISHISRFTWLEPGDLIATGSPGGTAISMDPPVWLKPGDEVKIEIEKIGLLRNTVAKG